jgi:hypothetical protein
MAILGNTTLTGCNSIPDFIGAGYTLLFYNTASPPSWTKVITHENKALRVVSGNGGGVGGSQGFTATFATRAVSGGTGQEAAPGSVGNHTIDWNQMPSHDHGQGSTQRAARSIFNPVPTDGGEIWNVGDSATGPAGGNGQHAHPFAGGQHAHPFVGNNQDFNVAYIDIILCTKN